VAIIGLVVVVRWGMRKLSGSGALSSTELTLRELQRRRSMATDEGLPETDVEAWLAEKTEPPDVSE
jgi:hypothetical protein